MTTPASCTTKQAIQTKPGSVGASFGYVCNENICKNAAHVQNILCEFERDPRLGLLCPPFPHARAVFHEHVLQRLGPQL